MGGIDPARGVVEQSGQFEIGCSGSAWCGVVTGGFDTGAFPAGRKHSYLQISPQLGSKEFG